MQKFSCPHCRGETSSPSRKQSIAPTTIQPPPPIQFHTDVDSLSSVPPAPPPPPPILPNSIPMPPPPMPGGNYPLAPPAPPAPPLPAPNLLSIKPYSNTMPSTQHRSITPEPSMDPDKLLPQQETPVPKAKMKTINWNKIPPNKVMGKHNIWTIVANSHQNSPMADLDWGEMEGLFCQQATNTQGSPKLGNRDGADTTLERKSKKENSEIILLDGKRSLNVNIFLKQFRT